MSLSVNIKKKMPDFTLDGSFEAENEFFAVLGESGCGKSLTLRCIAGIETPDEGRIVLNNRVLFDSERKINLSPKKRKIGYLFQDYALFPNMTVEENIAFGLKLKRRKMPMHTILSCRCQMGMKQISDSGESNFPAGRNSVQH